MRRTHLALALAVLALAGCSGVSKIDYGQFYRRAGWQKPDRVVASLGLKPGDRVADIGAGDGYFVPYLAEAVGPNGTVYAVEVDPELAQKLEQFTEERDLSNVVVILGEYEDPMLPDGEVDVVFLCNTYHHIEERPEYFARLRDDLASRGRVAIVEPNADLGGVLSLFHTKGHVSSAPGVSEEMGKAGYASAASFDFLPIQVFEVFTPRAHGG